MENSFQKETWLWIRTNLTTSASRTSTIPRIKDWSVKVPALEDLERRFGFVTVQADGGPATFLLLGMPVPVVLEDGTPCWGAYAVQELDDACVPFGEVALLAWDNILDFSASHEPDRIIAMREFLGLEDEN